MPHFFSDSCRPDPKKNFFQNYADHLNFLHHKFKKKYDCFMEMNTVDMKLFILKEEVLEHLNVFEKIRDGHDYMDEIMGATAIPVMGVAASLCSLALAIWETGKMLCIKTGFVSDDGINHKNKALNHLLLSCVSLVLGVTSLVKSIIALVTRPVVTAIQGFAEQDEERFLHSDSAVHYFMN